MEPLITAVPRSRIDCPVDGCEWGADNQPPEVEETALANVFGLGVMSAIARNGFHRDLENRIDQHLNTHSVLEWVRTVTALRDKVAALELRRELAEIKTQQGSDND